MEKKTEKAIESLVTATVGALGDELNERELPVILVGLFVMTSDGDSLYMSSARSGVQNKRILEISCLERTVKRMRTEA